MTNDTSTKNLILVPAVITLGVTLLRLTGELPASAGKAIGFAVLAFAIMPLVGFAAAAAGLSQQSPATFGIFVVVAVAGGYLAYRAWPGLGRTLFAYALAARIPVAIVMLIAILANWGTHYDVSPPGVDLPANPVARWLMIGLVPQLTIWIWFTLALGAITGSIAAAIAGRRAQAA